MTRLGDAPRIQCNRRILRAVVRRDHRSISAPPHRLVREGNEHGLLSRRQHSRLGRRRVARFGVACLRQAETLCAPRGPSWIRGVCESECGRTAAAAGDWSGIRVVLRFPNSTSRADSLPVIAQSNSLPSLRIREESLLKQEGSPQPRFNFPSCIANICATSAVSS